MLLSLPLSTAFIVPLHVPLSIRLPSRARAILSDLDVLDQAMPQTSFANGFNWLHEWYPLAFSKVTDKTVTKEELLAEDEA